MSKPKLIETPERMWELFLAYKNEIRDNPIYAVEQKKGNTSIRLTANSEGSVEFKAPSDIVQLPMQRPLTMEGFECYVFEQGLNAELSHYFSNYENRYADYVAICSHIRKMIRTDQIEGGMVGIYNPSITQRLNGLADKQEIKVDQYDVTLKLS